MEGWTKYKIGNLCSISSSKRIFAKEYQSSGIPFFRGKEIIEKQKGEHVSTELYISKSRYDEIKNKFGVPKEGDMLLTSVGTLGIPYIVKNEIFYFKDGNLTWFTDFKEINSKFLYYWFLSPIAKNTIEAKAIGSTQKALTIDALSKFEIDVPNIDTQNRIVSILSSLDDKIELNRHINENLEQHAQALFKSWFVDFEPFKDGKFVDSELGKIPEGWQVGTFKDIIHSTLSGDWGKECKQGNHIQKVFCIRGADIPNIKRGDKGNMPTRFIIEKNFQSKALMDGDMVIEVSGGSPTQATGRACRISRGLLDKYNHSIVCTNFCRAIKPLSQYSSFLYYMWEMFYNQGIMFSYENGTTGIKNLDINGLIQKEPIIIPPVEIALEFEKITQIYYEKIQSNGVESEMLSQLRDTLLPRLMSGKLEIKDNSYD